MLPIWLMDLLLCTHLMDGFGFADLWFGFANHGLVFADLWFGFANHGFGFADHLIDGLLPMLMLLLLVLFGRLVQVVVLQIFVIQIVAIQILVVQMIAATHPNCHGRVLPHSKGHIHGQRMVTHNYTVLNNHKNVTMLVVSEVNKG